MKKFLLIILISALSFAACHDDEVETYPSIITEFAIVKADALGALFQFTTDDGITYDMLNRVEGYDTLQAYRVVCGFVPEGKKATVYQLYGVHVLHDSTSVVSHDPINVLSAWRSSKYLNMQLLPRTQGGRQYWGFAIDSLRTSHLFVSLHHKQNNDPTSYSQNVYASLPLDSIIGRTDNDTLTLSICTFSGTKQWVFPPQP